MTLPAGLLPLQPEVGQTVRYLIGDMVIDHNTIDATVCGVGPGGVVDLHVPAADVTVYGVHAYLAPDHGTYGRWLHPKTDDAPTVATVDPMLVGWAAAYTAYLGTLDAAA